MAEITLGNAKEKKTLTVNIGKRSYSVPLAGSLTFAETKKLRDNEDGLSFFENYIPREILENLTVDDFRALTEAWKEASKGDIPEVGES